MSTWTKRLFENTTNVHYTNKSHFKNLLLIGIVVTNQQSLCVCNSLKLIVCSLRILHSKTGL
jgi:hypothetical protein